MNRTFLEIVDYNKIKESSDASAQLQTGRGTGTEYASCTDTDCESIGNVYGAAGSSAGMSDSELLSLRPPDVKIGRGRQRMNRYKTRNEIIREKLKQSGRKISKKKKAKNAAVPAALMTIRHLNV